MGVVVRGWKRGIFTAFAVIVCMKRFDVLDNTREKISDIYMKKSKCTFKKCKTKGKYYKKEVTIFQVGYLQSYSMTPPPPPFSSSKPSKNLDLKYTKYTIF